MFQDEFCIIYYSGDELEHHIFKPNRLLFLMYKDESSPPFNPEKILKFLSENRIPEMFFFEITQISATKLTQKYFTLLSRT